MRVDLAECSMGVAWLAFWGLQLQVECISICTVQGRFSDRRMLADGFATVQNLHGFLFVRYPSPSMYGYVGHENARGHFVRDVWARMIFRFRVGLAWTLQFNFKNVALLSTRDSCAWASVVSILRQ